MDFIKRKPVDLWIAESTGNLILWSNEVCLFLAPAVTPGLQWKEISAVTFDMGGRLCLCGMPAAQPRCQILSLADSLPREHKPPWQTAASRKKTIEAKEESRRLLMFAKQVY